VAYNIVPIIPHGVGVETGYFFGQVVIDCRQSKTTDETLQDNVVMRQSATAYNEIFEGDDPALDMTIAENVMEIQNEPEERTCHTMAMVRDCLEMWQCSRKLHTTHKTSHAQSKQMMTVGYSSDIEEIVKECE
jgi:hypothetical protein